MQKEKQYEEYAKSVLLLMNDSNFVKSLNGIVQDMNNIMTDDTLTDKGKSQKIASKKADFEKAVKKQSDSIKSVVKEFCDTYRLEAPDDGKTHSTEMSNILKIIDLCGFALTPEVLKTAIEPIKNSANQLKMIENILDAKNKSSISGASYSMDVMKLIEEYVRTGGMGKEVGAYKEVVAYEEAFDQVAMMLNLESIISFEVNSNNDNPNYIYLNGINTFRIDNKIPYETYCLADNMMKVGQMYEELTSEHEESF